MLPYSVRDDTAIRIAQWSQIWLAEPLCRKRDGVRTPLRGGQLDLRSLPRVPSAAADFTLGYFRRSLREQFHAMAASIARRTKLANDVRAARLPRHCFSIAGVYRPRRAATLHFAR